MPIVTQQNQQHHNHHHVHAVLIDVKHEQNAKDHHLEAHHQIITQKINIEVVQDIKIEIDIDQGVEVDQEADQEINKEEILCQDHLIHRQVAVNNVRIKKEYRKNIEVHQKIFKHHVKIKENHKEIDIIMNPDQTEEEALDHDIHHEVDQELDQVLDRTADQ